MKAAVQIFSTSYLDLLSLLPTPWVEFYLGFADVSIELEVLVHQKHFVPKHQRCHASVAAALSFKQYRMRKKARSIEHSMEIVQFP